MITVFYHSLSQAFLSTGISCGLGLVLAWLFVHTPPHPAKKFLRESLVLFFMVPTIPLVLGLLHACQFFGWPAPYGLKGIVLCHVCLNAPFIARTVLKAYDRISGSLWREAHHLKMTTVFRFRLLEWPYLRKAFLQGSIIVFCLCFSSFSIPFMLTKSLQTTSLSLALYQEIILENHLSGALIYLIPFILVILTLTTGLRRSVTTQPAPPLHAFYRPKYSFLTTIGLIAILAILMLPLIIFIKQVLATQILEILGDSEVLDALFNSVLLAFLSAVLATSLSFIVVALLRGTSQKIAFLLISVFLLPNFLIGFAASLLLGSFVDFHTFLTTVILHSLLPLPLSVPFLKEHWLILKNQGERVSQTLRLTPWQSLLYIYIPQLKAPLKSLFALSAAFSLGDVGASAFFGASLQTLPTLILESLSAFNLEKSLVLSCLILASVGLFYVPSLLQSAPSRQP